MLRPVTIVSTSVTALQRVREYRRVRDYERPTGHKRRSAFERYNIVSECDLVEAAKKLNAMQPIAPGNTVRLKPDTTYEEVPTDHDREHGPATTKPRSGEVGHNLGTLTRRSTSRRSMSL